MNFKSTKALCASGVLALVIAGCGGGTTSRPPSSNKSPITLPVIVPLTGPEAFIGTGQSLGFNLAANVINAAGGIRGRKVVLQYLDDSADPVDSVAAMNKAVNEMNAKVVLGPTSITAGATLPIAVAGKVLNIPSGGSTAFDRETYPYFFRLSVSDGVMATAMAKYALDRNWTRAVEVFVQQPAALSIQAPLAKTYVGHGGKVLGVVDIAVGQTSYSSALEQIYAYKPQVIFSQVDPTTAAVLFPEAQSLGFMHTPWVGTNVLSSSQFYTAIGSTLATDGLFYSAQSGVVSGTGASTFLSEYNRAYHTTTPANGANNSYDGLMTVALAMDEASSLTPAAITKAMMQVINPPGVVTASYKQALALIKAGKRIDFALSSSAGGFNGYHNVFGPFSILQFTAGGNTKSVASFSAPALKAYSIG